MKTYTMLKNISVWFFIALGLCVAQPSSALSLHSPKYQLAFKTYWAKYMPGHSAKILAAQCYQESRYQPYAISPVGAKGLCQFMPATWQDMQQQLKFKASAFHAIANIRAAAYYDSKLYHRWTTKRPYQDKINLMLACYNAGCGNVDKAQRQCNMASLYKNIIKCLPLITGKHAQETINYVIKINRYRQQLSF